MFETKLQDMFLSNLNIRIEKHGSENVGAADLTVSFDSSNAILNQFQDGLVERFYTEPPKQDKKAAALDLDGEDQVPEIARLSLLCCTKIKKVSWSDSYPGYRVRVMNPLEDKCDVLLPDAELKGFVFEMKQGGTVNLSFKIGCIPEPKDVAYLFEHLGSSLSITLEPPNELDFEAEAA